jgi:putative radical SAM enzyme (TIGR03279 family)
MRKQSPGGIVTTVEPGSLAAEIDLRPGDRLLAVNGHALRDIIDVQFYGAEESVELEFERDGEPWLVEVERGYDEEWGWSFANPTFDIDIRRCANNCDFCFVKQNAPGMRRSLYVKDDDYRYSFLFGNFVTLTNLTEADWDRLEEQRLSPLYVSVHASDPALRRRFLSRKNAPDVMDQLQRLAELGIEVHTQVVVVPGLNDGRHLERTVRDLRALYDRPVASLGVVPIGLTRFHSGACRTHTPVEAQTILDQIEPWRCESREAVGSSFVYPSDEWYLVAGRPVPAAGEYDGFPQIENGVGMVRRLLDEWQGLKSQPAPSTLRPATLACGTLIAPVLGLIVDELNVWAGGDGSRAAVRLAPVVNRFFGPVTTVSGLMTGQDIVANLGGTELGEVVLLPSSMFRGSYGGGSAPPDMTLDDMSRDEIEAALGVPVVGVGTLTEALAVLDSS